MNLIILGLILDIVGVLILTLMAIINYPHQRIGQKEWWKKYWWQGWKPISKISPPSGKPHYKIKWTHKVPREGFIPPNHKGNIAGFLFILFGFLFQIIGNMSV